MTATKLHGEVRRAWKTKSGLRAVVKQYPTRQQGLDPNNVRNDGHLCGYVGVECEVRPFHILYGLDMSSPIIRAISIHGGVTYSKDEMLGISTVHDVWWFGFDCAHHGDLLPDATPRHGETRDKDFTVCDLQYVTWNCESLAEQIDMLATSLQGNVDNLDACFGSLYKAQHEAAQNKGRT